MKKKIIITVALTEDQVELLEPLQSRVDADTDMESPDHSAGAIIAQIYPIMGTMICRYVQRKEVVTAYEKLGIELPK